MCGIVGIAGKAMSVKHERAFKTMLILDTLRGIDSTGAVIVHRDGTYDAPKAVGHAYNLLESRVFNNAMQGFHSVLLGHNRWATQGRVNLRNAHPFEFSDVVGVHNGTLKNKHYLKDGHKFDVDSEALYSHINELGVEDAIRGLDGAWALVWYNHEEATLNFLRNKERPLFMSVTKEEQLVWASEPWMIETALDREQIEFTDPVLLPEDQWHKIAVFNDGSLGKPHVVPLASRFQPYVYQGYDGSQQQQTAITQATTAIASAIEGGKTIDSVKKEEETKDSTPFSYPKGVEVKLFVSGVGHDTNGGRYYMLRDTTAPDRSIRLFINQNDKTDLLNKFVWAELHTFTVRDRYGLYYKVQHSTVRLDKPADPAVKIDVTKEVVEQSQSHSDKYFHDHQGRLIEAAEWHKKYGQCGWCSAYVNPVLDFKFTTSGDALCHECAHDSEVKKYVNLC